jgi:hypothetical protein
MIVPLATRSPSRHRAGRADGELECSGAPAALTGGGAGAGDQNPVADLPTLPVEMVGVEVADYAGQIEAQRRSDQFFLGGGFDRLSPHAR